VPAVSEEIMVSRDIALSNHTGCKTHIAHISCEGSIRVIADAKEDGVPITAEVTPHHIFLTEEAVSDYDPNTKVNPPLRTEKDTKAIRQAIKSGIIDCIATDHAPHSLEKKDIEYQLSKSGMIGLETALSLCLDLVHQNDINLMTLIKLMSTNPAKILGVSGGSLEKGKPADVVIFNLNEEWTYTEDKILSKSKNTPFKGRKMKGKVRYTICDGKIVWSA
jgi:dihydroorotase